jgi:hypothetical protein
MTSWLWLRLTSWLWLTGDEYSWVTWNVTCKEKNTFCSSGVPFPWVTAVQLHLPILSLLVSFADKSRVPAPGMNSGEFAYLIHPFRMKAGPLGACWLCGSQSTQEGWSDPCLLSRPLNVKTPCVNCTIVILETV